MSERHIGLAITGASGAVYGLRIIGELVRAGCRLSILVSRPGFIVLREECGLDWHGDAARVTEEMSRHFSVAKGQLSYYADDDFYSPLASGSSAPDTMIVAPCSMGSLARIAAGISGTLLERAADVMLKEARPLVLVPRETPLSVIHLENMLKLARMGVRIVPAMPGFYGGAQNVDDLIDFVAGKVLDQVGIAHQLCKRWGTLAIATHIRQY